MPPAGWRVAGRRALRALACGALLAAVVAPAQQAVRQDGDTLYFEGQINAASAGAFLRLLRDAAITTLVIRSRGGHVGPALDMAEAIHARRLDIEVPAACHSSCANYLFPAARGKRLGRPGAVAWHGNMAHVLYLARTGQGSWSPAELAQAEALAAREAAFFERIGVDGFVCWFAKLPPYSVDDMYFLSGEDMERFGIREVSVRQAAPAAGPVPVAVDAAALAAARAAASAAR